MERTSMEFREVISLPSWAQNVLPGQLSLPSRAHSSSPPHEGFPYSSGHQALSFPYCPCLSKGMKSEGRLLFCWVSFVAVLHFSIRCMCLKSRNWAERLLHKPWKNYWISSMLQTFFSAQVDVSVLSLPTHPHSFSPSLMLSSWNPGTLWGSALDLCELLRLPEPHWWGVPLGGNGAAGQAGLLWMTGREAAASAPGPDLDLISGFSGLEEKFPERWPL